LHQRPERFDKKAPIPPDRGLTEIDAELEQLAERGVPQRIGRTHSADQVADFGIPLGSSRTA
jgi:hypothetical protein